MIDFNRVKVIIWDLDETLWRGTLSEGDVFLPNDRVVMLKSITDCGVINSICSKNDYLSADNTLNQLGIRSYFVFPSINWEPKGMRVKTLLMNMSLRAENALFIDDNESNIREVEFYNSGIMSALPDDLNEILAYYLSSPKTDLAHKRLAQYKILESKFIESQRYNSNLEFLESCDIHVEFVYDVENYLDRIFELIQRTNQLNFTKVRCDRDELIADLSNNNNISACIRVCDRFGNYGIVGFYLLHNNCLKHFLFSCRTIGLGIEQYVYAKLGYPSIIVKPEVAVELKQNESPHWITEGVFQCESKEIEKVSEKSILFKGPCDMSGMVGYLQLPNSIDKEFTFTNDKGQLIETHNHSCHIWGSYIWSTAVLSQLKTDAFFISDDNVRKNDFSRYKFIFLSTLIEGIYGRYKHKDSGAIVAFGHYNYPLTDTNNWTSYISSKVQDYGYHITEEQLKAFADKFVFIDRTSPEDYVSFLKWIMTVIPQDTILCLFLGSEIPFLNETDSSYFDRADYHKALNNAIRTYAQDNDRIKIIEFSNYIESQRDFSNNINHFTPSVYFRISRDVLSIIKESDPSFQVTTSKTRFLIKQYIQPLLLSILPSKVYNHLRGLYVHPKSH